jgi:hypothetical protein
VYISVLLPCPFAEEHDVAVEHHAKDWISSS